MGSTTNRNSSIKILQWNSQSLKPKLDSFESLLLQEKIHLALISESWLNPDSNISIRNYQIFRRDRDDSYGGVAIVAHKSVRCAVGSTILSNTGIEVLHLKLFNCRMLENIVSVYCPSSVRTTDTDWDELFSLNYYFNDNIQIMYNYFLDLLCQAINKSVPLIKICTVPVANFTPREYWNPTLSKSVAKRRLALSAFRRNPTPSNLIELEKNTDEANKLIYDRPKLRVDMIFVILLMKEFQVRKCGVA